MSYDGYTSIHGICFDEGMSGNCGLECNGFIYGDCEIPEEIFESLGDEIDNVIIENMGELRHAVMMHQTKFKVDKIKILMEIFGYEI